MEEEGTLPKRSPKVGIIMAVLLVLLVSIMFSTSSAMKVCSAMFDGKKEGMLPQQYNGHDWASFDQECDAESKNWERLQPQFNAFGNDFDNQDKDFQKAVAATSCDQRWPVKRDAAGNQLRTPWRWKQVQFDGNPSKLYKTPEQRANHPEQQSVSLRSDSGCCLRHTYVPVADSCAREAASRLEYYDRVFWEGSKTNALGWSLGSTFNSAYSILAGHHEDDSAVCWHFPRDLNTLMKYGFAKDEVTQKGKKGVLHFPGCPVLRRRGHCSATNSRFRSAKPCVAGSPHCYQTSSDVPGGKDFRCLELDGRAPRGWTCDPKHWDETGDSPVCDCGCGLPDPDCYKSGASFLTGNERKNNCGKDQVCSPNHKCITIPFDAIRDPTRLENDGVEMKAKKLVASGYKFLRQRYEKNYYPCEQLASTFQVIKEKCGKLPHPRGDDFGEIIKRVGEEAVAKEWNWMVYHGNDSVFENNKKFTKDNVAEKLRGNKAMKLIGYMLLGDSKILSKPTKTYTCGDVAPGAERPRQGYKM